MKKSTPLPPVDDPMRPMPREIIKAAAPIVMRILQRKIKSDEGRKKMDIASEVISLLLFRIAGGSDSSTLMPFASDLREELQRIYQEEKGKPDWE